MASQVTVRIGRVWQARLGRDGTFGWGPFRTGMVRFGRQGTERPRADWSGLSGTVWRGRQGRVRTGTDWFVQVGQACHGGEGLASVWRVAVRQVGQRRSRTGTDWCGGAGKVGRVLSGIGLAWYGLAGEVGRVTGRLGTLRQARYVRGGGAWIGEPWFGIVILEN